MLGVSFITFMAGYLAPGDPISLMLGVHYDPVTHARLMHLYGLDRPWWQQYASFVWSALHGDLGTSYVYHVPATTIIGRGLPATLLLGALALGLTMLVGIPAGIVASLWQGRMPDRLLTLVMMALYAVPSFVLIPVLRILDITAYTHRWPSLPVAGWGGPQFLVFPVLVYTATSLGFIARITRGSMIEVARMDYVRTARAKGVSSWAVVVRHTFRNALLPVVTVIGPSVAFLVTGAFVIEALFNVPGIAYNYIQSVSQKDYPVIEATTLLLAFAVAMMNVLVDLLYAVIDPRIRLG